MKNLLPLLLILALTACASAPADTVPLTTPTPSPTETPTATPTPAATDFYTLDTFNGTLDTGTAYYEFSQQLGHALLLKTDYAAATQSVCCEIPGCAHDTDACPAYFPGRASRYMTVAAGDAVYVWHISFVYTDQSWDDFWAEAQASGIRNAASYDTMTDDEFEADRRGIWTEQTTPPRLYVVDPATGKTYTDLPLSYRDYTIDVCDGVSLYGEQLGGRSTGATPACRIDLATGQAETFKLEPTEYYLTGFDGALLTRRYVTDAPLPTDAEQYAAAIQSATVEIDRYDPRTGARTKLAERPYNAADYENNGCFAGVYNDKAYFEERETTPEGGFRRTALTAIDAAGNAETVWDPWPQADWILGDDGGRYIWLYKNNYDAGYTARALLDIETGDILPVTQTIPDDPDNYGRTVRMLGKTNDGRWLVITGVTHYENAAAKGTYGLIDADDFAAGGTDWQDVTMWEG